MAEDSKTAQTRNATLAGNDAHREVGTMVRLFGAVHVIVSRGDYMSADVAEELGHGGIGACRSAVLRVATPQEGLDAGLCATDMRALYARAAG